MNLGGQTVLITGGGTGIGFALARRLAKAGSSVLICGRREERLREAQQKLPGIRYRVCLWVLEAIEPRVPGGARRGV
jgi:uncharacterized oxidoreductase